MDIVKKNLASIICGVIALCALVALFWPIGPMFTQMDQTLVDRKKVYDQLESLRNTARFLPVLDLENAKQSRLETFPSPTIIEAGKQATKQVHEQSDKMLETAIELNKHNLLKPGTLPKITGGDNNFAFRDAYVNEITNVIPKEILKATQPPDDNEIALKEREIWETQFKSRIILIGGQPANRPQINEEFNAARAKLPDEMRLARARDFKVYMDPDAIAMSIATGPGSAPTLTDMWYAQQALWVQEDIATAIASANSDATNILDAPVKHLQKIDIAFDPSAYVISGDAASAAAQNVPRIFSVSPTGRVSNPLFMVVNFGLSLRVDARKIPLVINELEKNRFLTVLRVNALGVNSTDQSRLGFIYGDAPVAELALECEALFMRQFTDALMPDEVKGPLNLVPKTDQ